MTNLLLTIPIEPPSGNHYKKPSRRGGFLSFYHTPEAKAWFAAVADAAAGRAVEGKQHEMTVLVYRGKGSRGDLDNYLKVVGDGLQRAGVIKSDNSIVRLSAEKHSDWENPRTVITLRAI